MKGTPFKGTHIKSPTFGKFEMDEMARLIFFKCCRENVSIRNHKLGE